MLDPKEEARFDELKSMCRELKVPAPPEIMIGLQVHDHNGVLVFDDKQRGHSWTRNYWNHIAISALLQSSPWTLTPYAAGTLACAQTNGATNGTPGALFSASGITVGTGDTAFGVNQYALVAAIANGNGAGQLAYSAGVGGTPSYNGGTKIWSVIHSRIMNNNSGGSITIKESGVYCVGTNTFMQERSVLSPTVAVANGAQLTVTYTISMDFSAID
jgi:hypothetical protein